MSTNTTPRRRRTAAANSNFLQVALSPYWPGQPERHEVINTWTIKKVSPPTVFRSFNSTTKELIEVKIDDPRYTVTFKIGGQLECGRATRADLEAAGIPLPPEEPIAARMP